MYPKDYAARTKWKVGDPVMIFKQDIDRWCPGKITNVVNREDDIEVKYAILQLDGIEEEARMSPLVQLDEDEETEITSMQSPRIAEDDLNSDSNEDVPDDVPLQHQIPHQHSSEDHDQHPNGQNNRNQNGQNTVTMKVDSQMTPPRGTERIGKDGKLTLVSAGSGESITAEPPTPFTPRDGAGGTAESGISKSLRKQRSRLSKINVIDAAKLAKIDFVNDSTLEKAVVNRYDRDIVRPMIIKNHRNSISVTIDAKNKTSEILDKVTGLGNAVRLQDRLREICGDEMLAGISGKTGDFIETIEIIEENTENKENETVTRNKAVLNARNVHPVALMLVEVDQLSLKINLKNRRRSEQFNSEEFDEDFVMQKVAKVLDSIVCWLCTILRFCHFIFLQNTICVWC